MRKLPVVPTCRTGAHLPRRANHKHFSARPAALKRGASGHERWQRDAMDTASRETNVEITDGEGVWSWRPDAALSSHRRFRVLRATGQESPVPGEEHETRR
jgi:hypothetical protein